MIVRKHITTVDSKIDENRCKQKYELIQVIYTGVFPKLFLSAVIHLPLFTRFNEN